MKAKKTLLILFGIFLSTLILGVGVGVFYYTHPPKVKALIEKAASRTTGASFSIRHLDYSLNPIRINAKGISFQPAGGGNGFSAEVGDFSADCFLSGTFGRKTLHFKKLRVKGFECRIHKRTTALPKNSSNNGSEEPSFLNSMAKFLISFFLFRDFKIEAAELEQGLVIARWSGGKIQISGLSGHLNNDHLVDIQGGILMDLAKENTNISIPNFHVETANAISLTDPRIDFTFAFPDGELKSSEAKVENIRAGATLHYDPLKQEMNIVGLSLTLGMTRLKRLPKTEKDPLHISFNATGEIELKKRKATFNGLSLYIKNHLQFSGTLDANLGTQPNFKLIVGEGRGFTKQLMTLLPTDVREKSGDFNISGPVDFSGTFSGMENQGQWAFDCHAEGSMKNNPVSYRTQKIHIKGLMTAQVALQGPISNLKLSGNLAGNQIAFKEKSLSLKSAEGAFNFSGTYPYFDIRDLSCRIPEMTHLKGTKFSIEHIGSHKGQVNILKRSLNFPEIKLNSSLLKNVLAAIKMNANGLTLTAKAKEAGLIRTARALKLLPPHWTFKGMDSVEIEAVMDKNGAISFSAGLALDKFDFQNPEETYLGENLSLRARISGHMPSPQSTIEAVAGVDAHKGEVLMDRFYFDLKENPFSAKVNGAYQGLKKRLQLENFSVEMKKIAAAYVKGTLFQSGDEYEGDLFLTIPDTPLKTPFHRLIREPFQMEKPALSKIKLDGAVGAEISLKGKRSRWMTQGVFTWKDGSMFYGDSKFSLTGIHLSLPLRLTNVKDKKATQKLEGGLSVHAMRLPFLPEQGLNIPIHAAWNGLLISTATTLAVPGGTIHIGPSSIMGLMGSSPVIQSALHFKNLQMEPILKNIWPHPVKGIAEGILDPIHIVGGRLQSKGKIKANIFDGALTLSHVGARGLFTALPVYGLDAIWRHLNLADITKGTSFGKIEGILNGYAKKLEVSNGQLQRFDLLLNTAKTDDVPQRISVKAVDNIARLGGGQSPFAGLAGIFVSLFKEFPYEKIGVHATLENDVFRIHGTIREDGREYLVKRGFFSGVDVINQSKENRVGFRDMLKRMKRISSSKGGPVIQ